MSGGPSVKNGGIFVRAHVNMEKRVESTVGMECSAFETSGGEREEPDGGSGGG